MGTEIKNEEITVFFCDSCEAELHFGEYICTCDECTNQNIETHFCNADCWIEHVIRNHADRTFGHLHKDGSIAYISNKDEYIKLFGEKAWKSYK